MVSTVYIAIATSTTFFQYTTQIILLQHGGLCDIDLDSRVRISEDSLLKILDDISTEKKHF